MSGWWLRALCRETGVDDELWFGRRNRVEVDAVRLCRRCPVQMQCLADALADDARLGDRRLIYGIRGGLTATERASLLAHLEQVGGVWW